jgi:hypothetical protein
MDFGTDQVVELLARLSEQQDVNLPLPATEKKRTLVQWKQLVTTGEAWTILFRDIPCHFTGTLTTTGVRAHWHVGQSKVDKKAKVARNRAVRATNERQRRTDAAVPRGERRKKETHPTAVPAWRLGAKHHGLHGHDVLVAPDGTDNATFVYVDPGHATLIHAIRQHASPVAAVVVPPGPYTKRRRVLLKQHALAQKNQSEFVLTNRHWEARDQEGLGQDQAVETGRPPEPTTRRGSTGRCVSQQQQQQQHAPFGVLAVHKGETGNDGGLRRGVPTSSSPTVETGDVPG